MLKNSPSINLYKQQREAVDKLRTGSILVGGVGTGKSRTSLAYYVTKVCGGTLPKRNYGKYDRGTKVPLIVITTAKKRDSGEWLDEATPFLIGDEMVVDSWNNISKYTETENAFFIFDEQRLVGYGAWSKSFLKIARKNDWILLSATPGDTWMDYCVVFIANGYYRNKTDFTDQHVIYHRFVKFPKIERYVNTRKLQKNLDETLVVMSYEKEAVQHHEWVKVGYDQEAYKRVTTERWDIFELKPLKNASELCALQRKIVNGDIRRLKAVSNVTDNHPKALVFYNFDYELEALRHFCDTSGYPYAEMNGHKHDPLPEGDNWLYLVQYNAGAEGWNCIQTDTTIFFSQNYSYRISVQSAGRIDRMNTPYKDLYYYHLFSDSSIDQAIRRCLRAKKDFNERIFVEELPVQPQKMGEQLTLF